jgi:putative thiamine transport system permease protein
LAFRTIALTALTLIWGLPLVSGLLLALSAGLRPEAWQAALGHPQLAGSITLSLWTGSAALILSLGLSLVIVAGLHRSRYWPALGPQTGILVAFPHLAFAIGLSFLIMPSGLLARVIAQCCTGWDLPPDWVTSQDPAGLALIGALVLKETPFLVWIFWGQLTRGDTALMFEGQSRVARSLGHSPASAWLRLFIPQLLRQSVWPIVIVWVYGVTVVDMAMVIGPTQPPVNAVVTWADLNDADRSTNLRGMAGTLVLSLVLAATGVAGRLALRGLAPLFERLATAGPPLRKRATPRSTALTVLGLFALIYFAAGLALAVMSVGTLWVFPAVLPSGLGGGAWLQLALSPWPTLNSLWLAMVSTCAALAMSIAWFESTGERHDRSLMLLAVAALAIPQIMLASGQYEFLLRLNLAGSGLGVLWLHLTPVTAYTIIALKGPYRAFDPRLRSVALGLNCSPWRFFRTVKLPLLAPALGAAGAVAFAVSLAQYIPTQLAGGGRISTLPVEAVTLASGGSRPLLAAHALALGLLTAAGFLTARALTRQNWAAA